MKGSNYTIISVAAITSFAIFCCIRESVATAQNGKETVEDFVATVKPKQAIRHVIALKNSRSSVSRSIMDLELSTRGEPDDDDDDDDSSYSGEVEFGGKVDSKFSSQSTPVSSITQSNQPIRRKLSSDSLGHDEKTNSSSTSQPAGSGSGSGSGAADSSETTSRNKVVRAVANDKEIVVIDANADGAKLDGKESTGSNLWIYLNVVCILLVVAVSIFLIYYPKIRRDRRTACNNSSQTSSESSASSVPA